MGNVCFTPSGVLCNNFDLVYFQPVIIDIYYGVWSGQTVTENIILSTFNTDYGLVGALEPDGRLYSFLSGYYYKYWCIPDMPNDSNRVIGLISNGIVNTVLAYDLYYNYYQYPAPNLGQSITYGKININGFTYRIYRTKIRSSQNEYVVYSF